MLDVRFILEPFAGKWRVRVEGEVFAGFSGRAIGPFDDFETAMTEMMAVGREVEAMGYLVHVDLTAVDLRNDGGAGALPA